MTTPVHILATCNNRELAQMTSLVFATLRIGFPSAPVTVHVNGNCEALCPEILSLCTATRCQVIKVETIHHEWIENLVRTQTEPFYILDTDAVFFESVEGWSFSSALAGRLIPEWQDAFSGCLTRARLHTSLLRLDPEQIKERIATRPSPTPFTPNVNLFHPLVLPLHRRNYFYDTASLLYHQLGGEPFSACQLDAFFHFNFGTISDLVLPRLPDRETMAEAREKILANPSLGRGRWREQDEYYQARQFDDPGEAVIGVPHAGNSENAVNLNRELCCGNPHAELFCDQWYHYCHGIDDLIDTRRDGRPVMSREQIISLFLKAAVLYNSPFYLQHQSLLFPIILQTTNTYADSVAWEASPRKHLRTMADVFRTCGNEMYFMVALICGGETNMRKFSPLIKERDWLGQHDEHGNPI